jgi:hypothetical protein
VVFLVMFLVGWMRCCGLDGVVQEYFKQAKAVGDTCAKGRGWVKRDTVEYSFPVPCGTRQSWNNHVASVSYQLLTRAEIVPGG